MARKGDSDGRPARRKGAVQCSVCTVAGDGDTRARPGRHADSRPGLGWSGGASRPAAIPARASRRIADRSSDPVACHHADDDDAQAASVHACMAAWVRACQCASLCVTVWCADRSDLMMATVARSRRGRYISSACIDKASFEVGNNN